VIEFASTAAPGLPSTSIPAIVPIAVEDIEHSASSRYIINHHRLAAAKKMSAHSQRTRRLTGRQLG
jgi:hypothetical protein